MKETTVVEKEKGELRNPFLIVGLPGLGLVGKIAVDYLSKQLGAERLAELYSPHFAYYVIVTSKGSVRLLRSVFRYWRNDKGGNDLIFLTGDVQAQTVEGQYEVADRILDYAAKRKVELVVTIGGYRKEAKDVPQVLASATSQTLLTKALDAGARDCPSGNPIVGAAGLLLGLARFRDMDAVCLMVETQGYLPDPKAAKSVLSVIAKMLGFEVDLSGLDEEIYRSRKIEERMQKIEEQRRALVRQRRKADEEKVSYIS